MFLVPSEPKVVDRRCVPGSCAVPAINVAFVSFKGTGRSALELYPVWVVRGRAVNHPRLPRVPKKSVAPKIRRKGHLGASYRSPAFPPHFETRSLTVRVAAKRDRSLTVAAPIRAARVSKRPAAKRTYSYGHGPRSSGLGCLSRLAFLMKRCPDLHNTPHGSFLVTQPIA